MAVKSSRRHRPSRYSVAPAALALLALLAAALLAPGCAEKPAAPTWTNPFDPANPGDPFNLQAYPSGNGIVVLWSRPDVPDVAGYEILRSTNGVAFGLAGETDDSVTQFLDLAHAPGDTNWYKVRVVDSAGEVSGTSRQVAVPAVAPPYLEIAGGAAQVGSRYAMLTVRTVRGTELDVAATRDFAGAQTFAITPGETTLVAWDLGPAGANGQRKHVWARARDGAATTPAQHDSVETGFRPDLQIAGRPATVASRTLPLEIAGGAGVVQLRFALSRAGLAGAAWADPDSVSGGRAWYAGEVLGPSPQPQWLYGEFAGDFGYAAVDSLRCVPDDLDGAAFTLAGGAALTGTRDVALASDAIAAEMRFAESPDLSAVPWLAYADTVTFTLSEGAGTKIVYGEYRNAWFSAVAADTITLVQTRRPR